MLKRTDRDRPGVVFGRMIEAYAAIQAVDSTLTATVIDDFLARVAATRGRELAGTARNVNESVEDLVRQVRSKYPLRERLKAHLPTRAEGHARLEAALQAQDAAGVREALRSLGPGSDGIHDEAMLEWAGRLWAAADAFPVLAEYWQTADPARRRAVAAGRRPAPARPPAVPVWDDDARNGLAMIDDGCDPAGPPAEGYRLFAEGCDELRRRFRLHPLEVPDVLAAVRPRGRTTCPGPDRFGGFCSDTFRFLAELAANNARAWMDGQRDRYRSPSASRWSSCAGRWPTATSSRC